MSLCNQRLQDCSAHPSNFHEYRLLPNKSENFVHHLSYFECFIWYISLAEIKDPVITNKEHKFGSIFSIFNGLRANGFVKHVLTKRTSQINKKRKSQLHASTGKHATRPINVTFREKNEFAGPLHGNRLVNAISVFVYLTLASFFTWVSNWRRRSFTKAKNSKDFASVTVTQWLLRAVWNV